MSAFRLFVADDDVLSAAASGVPVNLRGGARTAEKAVHMAGFRSQAIKTLSL